MSTDKGIKRAIGGKTPQQLPTNFTYLTMKRIREEKVLREKLAEQRSYIIMIAFSVLATCGVFYFLGEIYMDTLRLCLKNLSPKLQNSSPNFSINSAIIFYLPIVVSLILLIPIDRCLRKWLKL